MKAPVWLKVVAKWMVIASFPIWFLTFVVPFFPISTAYKLSLSGMCFLLGEALFWIGGSILGTEFISRFRTPSVTNGKSMQSKQALVAGATGGLGKAIVQATNHSDHGDSNQYSQ